MSKSISRPACFKIPTVEEVIAFMNEAKPDWPHAFCVYYGNKFWQGYQAKGWQITRGVKMKDWKAAFFCNWQSVDYSVDRAKLETELKSWQHKVLLDEKKRKSAGLFAVVEGVGPSPLDRFLESLDEIYRQWQIGQASEAQLRTAADWLKRNNLLVLSRVQIDRIIADQGNDLGYGKLLAIRQFFSNLNQKGISVSFFIKSRIPGDQAKTA